MRTMHLWKLCPTKRKLLLLFSASAAAALALLLLAQSALPQLGNYHHGRRWWWEARQWLAPPRPRPAPPGGVGGGASGGGGGDGGGGGASEQWGHDLTAGGRRQKRILLYTPFFENKNWGFTAEALSRCPQAACAVSTLDDEEEVAERGGRGGAVAAADAVAFHLINMRSFSKEDLDQINSWRRPEQRFVMFNLESPVHLGDWRNWSLLADFFNWTMTYREDSDVYCPYGEVAELEDDELGPPYEPTSNKTKMAFWLVSNCRTHSERERYFGELMRTGLQVDVLGSCGSGDCDLECEERMAREYRFYLSFENSVCEDYATEKFFKRLAQEVVPVVLGGANYSRLAPAGSFIDVRDFASPADLARHLLSLERDPEEYRRHFRWKRRHRVVPNLGWVHIGLCNLCDKLHRQEEEDGGKEPKTYHDLWGWFGSRHGDGGGGGGGGGGASDDAPEAACTEPESLPWSKYDYFYFPRRSSSSSSARSKHEVMALVATIAAWMLFFVVLVMAILVVLSRQGSRKGGSSSAAAHASLAALRKRSR